MWLPQLRCVLSLVEVEVGVVVRRGAGTGFFHNRSPIKWSSQMLEEK